MSESRPLGKMVAFAVGPAMSSNPPRPRDTHSGCSWHGAPRLPDEGCGWAWTGQLAGKRPRPADSRILFLVVFFFF